MQKPETKIPFELNTLDDFAGLLFDLDGTLADSMPSHNRAWQKALLPYEVKLTTEQLMQLAGIPNHKTAEIFIERYSLPTTPETLVRAKEEYFERSLDQLKSVSKVEDIVQTYYQKKPLGLVSGSTKLSIDRSLKVLQLEDLFDCIVSCEDTTVGKPFPDPYLLAAKQLKVQPEQCLVFEDGDAGLESAKRANMSVVLVREGHLFHWWPK